ncbi:MAG: cytochrome c3 family protein, partial [Candidatus Desulfatibia sp.]|uniref:cytochrome c3 family protein n=1 Tax=Candidatus Desulfatibia sp. TaxID=3101189 RepID=UPI002F312137
VRVCVGCHLYIKGTVPPQINEIRKIIEFYWKKGKPIPWKKVHDLPDFVNFSHKVHISAGFDCSNCHGDIMKTKTPEPFSLDGQIPQSMGWCLTCHNKSHPTYPYNDTYENKNLTERNLPVDNSVNHHMILKHQKEDGTCYQKSEQAVIFTRSRNSTWIEMM